MTAPAVAQAEHSTRWHPAVRTVARRPERVHLREDQIGRLADDPDAILAPGGVLMIGTAEWRLA